MKQKIDIDDLIRSTLRSEGMYSPGKDFTERVMSGLGEAPTLSGSYKPLLSRKILIGIICLVALIIAFIFFTPAGQSQSLFNTTFADKMVNYFSNLQFKFEIPTSISYIIVCALLMLLVQAILISKFISKRH